MSSAAAFYQTLERGSNCAGAKSGWNWSAGVSGFISAGAGVAKSRRVCAARLGSGSKTLASLRPIELCRRCVAKRCRLLT